MNTLDYHKINLRRRYDLEEVTELTRAFDFDRINNEKKKFFLEKYISVTEKYIKKQIDNINENKVHSMFETYRFLKSISNELNDYSRRSGIVLNSKDINYVKHSIYQFVHSNLNKRKKETALDDFVRYLEIEMKE